MGFLNDLGHNLSSAGQNALQKTQDMADIGKINGQIAAEEEEQQNKYLELGKLFYLQHKEDPQVEATLAPVVLWIKASEARVSDCRKQIAVLKGMIICPECGTGNQNGATYCVTCGKPLPVSQARPAAEKLFCTNCGMQLAQDMKFCTNCGTPVAQGE